MLTGETGTGKGELARWIHMRGPRAARAFVAVNCATLRGDLLVTELFGHARGAFTSAVRDRRGLVEEADGGTLFLDEIAEMDLPAQAQLLKVIEERSFRRVGEAELRRSDFRLLCATHRDLQADVESGRFRRDLYYRINVFPIEIPALRERREDIGPLAERLLEQMPVEARRLDPATRALLTAHTWPGNVRELRNALLRAALLARGGVLRPEHFEGLAIAALERTAEPASLPHRGVSASTQFVSTQGDDALRVKIVEAMTKHDRNRSRMARTLGISRTTLYRHLDRLGLSRAGK